MQDSKEYRQQQILEYKQIVMPLLRYLPWFEANAGKAASTVYSGDDSTGEGRSLAFPVYDSTVMNFVKEASKSPLMDINYRYVYTRNHIENHDQERKLIESATVTEWGILCGILSKYVLGGRTKGTLWSEAVSEQIFYLVLKQMKSIIEFWDQPFQLERLDRVGF
ncbi:MAG: hypothetical protein IJ833_10310 [Lachnospiraceae bacterium]|nr:hypothetical protein [Lachnospiraceae bacterium]